jgi:hypothetical protein
LPILKEKFSRPFQKLAKKLGITHKLIWKHKVDRTILQGLIANTLAICCTLDSL